MRRFLVLALVLFSAACHSHRHDPPLAQSARSAPPAPTQPTQSAAAPVAPRFDQLARGEFNFRAQERFLPLFWRADDNGNGVLDPEELSVLWTPSASRRDDYVDGHGFSARFVEAYAALLQPLSLTHLSPAEQRRRALVAAELRGGRPTLLETDLSKASVEERGLVHHILAAATGIERIHARQLGADALIAKIPSDDLVSRGVFHRNQGPFCVTPQLEKEPACSAVPGQAPRRSGLYPAELQADPKFCDTLAKQPNAKQLMDHFTVVVSDGAGFKAIPYSQAYREDMEAVARELDAAAAGLASSSEAPLRAYLVAAAQAFRSNDWEPANEAWAQMGGSSSRWYLRIAPDEVYYEPCAWKAGFALSFARVNPDSKDWRDKLEPVKGEMERALAKLAGPPYRARQVRFKLPDFIDVVVNAGDARHPHGGTIGQSLPNWGAVAARGGRTVAMTNLYTDADSQATLRGQMASLFCKGTMAHASTDAKPGTMSTVLHEAAHNLGPSHEYKVRGKEDDELFGGPLASTMEELKAQTSALYFSEWLVERGLLSRAEADEAHVRDVAWAFGHISRGMYDPAGKPKNYSQLASIQLGTLLQAKALVWKQGEAAANGSDAGCFELELARWKPAVDVLARRVLRAKGRGDRKDAEAMKAAFVDADDAWARHRAVITERWLRAPKATFVYGVR